MSKHLKKYAAPTSWPITRKDTVYITKPSAGPHALRLSMSIDLILRTLGYAQTKKEIKQILTTQEILVDGRRVNEAKFPVGLFDIFSIPSQKQHFRMVFDTHGRLKLIPITADEAKKKISKIIGKTILPGGKLQINLSDGRNLITTDKKYRVGDSILFDVPTQKIHDHLSRDTGATIYLIDGKHTADVGTLDAINKNTITYTTKDKQKVQTRATYAYVVGKQQPLITLT